VTFVQTEYPRRAVGGWYQRLLEYARLAHHGAI